MGVLANQFWLAQVWVPMLRQRVAETIRPVGLFVMAPAIFVPGYESYDIVSITCPVTVVHGWRDDVVPVECGIRFAQEHSADLYVLDSDHRLTESLEKIESLFAGFLAEFV